MKIRPHLTDQDLERTLDEIVALQRRDVVLLHDYEAFFREHAQKAAHETGSPVIILCNVETEEVLPSALDWKGALNILRLEAPIYQTAQEALKRADSEDVVVLLYHPAEDVLSIYTLTSPPEEESFHD